LNKRIAITGGAGFLGLNLVKLLIKNNTYQIVLLARSKKKYQNFFEGYDGIIFHEGDLLDSKSLNGFLTSDTILINLAYINNKISSNSIATSNLINAANEANVSQLVHCSSAVVVGFSSNKFITENTPLKPAGIYQLNKVLLEKLFNKNLSSTIPLIIIRPTEILGVENKTIVHKMINRHFKPSIFYKINNFLLLNRRFNLVSVHNVTSAINFLLNKSFTTNRNTFIISDDGDKDNNYKSILNIIEDFHVEKSFSKNYISLPIFLLEIIFKFFIHHSPPNRIYSQEKIMKLGFHSKLSISEATIQILTSLKKL